MAASNLTEKELLCAVQGFAYCLYVCLGPLNAKITKEQVVAVLQEIKRGELTMVPSDAENPQATLFRDIVAGSERELAGELLRFLAPKH